MTRISALFIIRDRGQGGIQRIAQRVAAQLESRVEVVVWADPAPGPVRLSTVGKVRVLGSEISRIRRAMRSTPEVPAIAFGYSSIFRTALAAIGTGTPWVASIRNSPREFESSSLRGRARRIAYQWALRSATLRHAISNELAAEIRDLIGGSSEIHVVRNGIPLDDFYSVRSSSHDGSDPNNLRVIYHGRLAPQKQLSHIIDAVHLSGLSGTSCAVQFVGDGPEESKLRERAMAVGIAVDFTGWTADVAAALDSSDVMVLTSRYEGFGTSLVEAMAAGLAVCTYDAPSGPREIAGNGRFGIVAYEHSPRVVSQVLALLHADRQVLVHFRQEAVLRSADFAEESMLEGYRSMISAAASRTRRRRLWQ